MMKSNTGKYAGLYNPQLIAGLLLLLLNDLVLKPQFHNWFTGKLSDIVGLYIFPLFWCAFFPALKRHIYLLTAAGFIFWKSTLAQPLIDTLNDMGLPFNRVVDMSDLAALPALIVSYALGAISGRQLFKRVSPAVVAVLAILVFCNDSIVRRHVVKAQHPYIKSFKTKLTQEDFFARLASKNIKYYADSVVYGDFYYDTSQYAVQRIENEEKKVLHFWRIKNLPTDAGIIDNVDFNFYTISSKHGLYMIGYDIDTLTPANGKAYYKQDEQYDEALKKSLKGLLK